MYYNAIAVFDVRLFDHIVDVVVDMVPDTCT